jgi:hypothetical protein
VDGVDEFVVGMAGELVDSVLEDILQKWWGRLCARCALKRTHLMFGNTAAEGRLDAWWYLCYCSQICCVHDILLGTPSRVYVDVTNNLFCFLL